MATLVLSVVGNYLGGPIGAAIGATIGQQIDQQLFAPPGRQGPRLNDLAVQSSSYGSKIPKLFGTMRVAGTVIWATNLTETSRTSGGKGAPKVTTYSYTTSFATLISAREIVGVGRIWADGNLLRGAAGDWKTQTGFRLYLGGEDQAIDPLIASAEGMAATPAYRGHAYAVFENMILDTYGRRIPSITFEVIADSGAVSFDQIITTLTGTGVAAHCPTQFGGYAASGDSVRGAVETLTAAAPLHVQDDGALLQVAEQVAPSILLARDHLGATAGGNKVQRVATTRRSTSTIPQSLALAYYDSARDFQQSMQRARRYGGARKEQRIDLPAVLDAASAKTLVERKFSTIWAERVTAKVQLPWRYLNLRPGDAISLPESNDTWRIGAMRLNKMVLECDLVRASLSTHHAVAADAGRASAQADVIAGPTILQLIDLPQLSDGVAAKPAVFAAAAGASPGWRSAALLLSIDGGTSWADAGQTSGLAIIGSALTTLASGSATLIDAANAFEVQLANPEMLLSDANSDVLLNGTNLALLGGELLQFGTATPLGNGRWRLGQLWRGRRGTEEAVAGHSEGESFVLLDTNTLAPLEVAAGVADVRVTAHGLGDVLPVMSDLPHPGLAVRPPSPVHLTATMQTNGDTLMTWIRRSRDGWRWADGVDAPLAEETEAYVVRITPSNGQSRELYVTSATALYSAADRAADTTADAVSITIEVRQIGTLQPSLAATLFLPLI